MRIARGRLRPAVTEQPADDGQALAEGERPRGETVPDVVDAHVIESGPRPDAPPRAVDVGHVRAGPGARYDPWISGDAREGGKHVHCGRRQVDRARARLAADDAHLGPVEIDVLPRQGHDLVLAATRQHQQPDRRHRAGRYPAAIAGDLAQHLAEAGELGLGQEAFPLALGVLRDGLAGIVAVLGEHLPVAGQHIHVAQGGDNHVGHGRSLAQALVQRHDVAALHRGERQRAEGRHDVAFDQAAGGALRLRLAADRHVPFEIASGQVGHRRAAAVSRRQRGDAADGETEGASLGYGVPGSAAQIGSENMVSKRT